MSVISRCLLVAWFCTVVLSALLASTPELWHWFVLPVWLCGMLIGIDALDWFLGRVDRFDPRGVIGLIGVHLFFLAPLLHVSWDYWMSYITPPDDWRPWLGHMAIINCACLLVYRICLVAVPLPAPARHPQPAWVVDERWFYPIAGTALAVAAVLQAWAYARFGGITGYMETATDLSTRNSMAGMGPVYMISETFPILAFMVYAVYARSRPWCRTWAALIPTLGVFFVLAILFGGLRGQRSTTVWNLFWAVGIIHLWIRPVPMKLLVGGAVFLGLFMYAYGLYKGAGLKAFDAFKSAEAHAALVEKTDRSLDGVILGDFGRSDVHAFLLYRLCKPDCDYEYARGRTYVTGFFIFVPRSIWPDRPHHKSKEGTEAQYGMGTFIPEDVESSKVYGLAGEGMLNFGPLPIPLLFIPWGLAVAWSRRPLATWHPDDARFLLYPYLVNFLFQVLILDMDNLVFFLVKHGFVPVTVLALSTVRRVLPAPGLPFRAGPWLSRTQGAF